nr:MAG: alpha/beta hydrolase [Bacteroidota bacterium]
MTGLTEAHSIELEGFRHGYYRIGAPNGKPLIGLHGFGTSGRLYRMTAPYWAEHGFTLYALDLLGFGQSEQPRICYSLPLYVELLCAFQEALDLGPVPLLAHSLSGKIGLAQALWHPERVGHLFLIAPAGWHPAEKLPLLGDLPFFGPLFRTLFTRAPVRDLVLRLLLPEVDSELRRAHLDTYTALVRSARWMDLDSWGLRSGLASRLRVPVTLLWGENDRLLPIRWAHLIRRRLPQARLAIIPRAGHLPMREQPEAFVQAVLETLAQYGA